MTSQPAPQPLSLFALTAMVVGLMVGSGIFSLPRTFGLATGPFGPIIAWLFIISTYGPNRFSLMRNPTRVLTPAPIFLLPGSGVRTFRPAKVELVLIPA